ncbi:ComF family protein [Natranaerobius thermophilus]|uniref:Amidophosphoribosyltransferase-like protein n=1 Tax=Natranaerobius thermophilus (strain ATCC BAA-1301 / DSM 18059 / JW/NM-WN-LF) TaxID=457570 RepID=B2A855_NATTJ|nr:ComF family protein [Natranaerobius thermophilus]ACB85823.1 amidophosphoribosyltransferase-like protein [Natranaerobius thermophilus JW/NM-WN-LF]
MTINKVLKLPVIILKNAQNTSCSLCREQVSTQGRLVYPPYTFLGDNLYLSETDFICADCLEKLELACFSVSENYSLKPMELITEVIYAGNYRGYMKELILRLKYQGEKELAIPLGKLMALALMLYLETSYFKNISDWKKLYLPLPYFAAVPVPLYRDRLVERGYNQSLLLGRVLAYETGISLQEMLIRCKATSPLKEKDPQERSRELSGAFIPKPMGQLKGKVGSSKPNANDKFNVNNKNNTKRSAKRNTDVNVFNVFSNSISNAGKILIIDDIYTTGATASEMAKVLKTMGFHEITLLTLSH